MGCGGSKDKDFDDIKITRDAADDARPANLLLEAARAGDAEGVKRLLKVSGEDVNQVDPEMGATPLMYAAVFGHTECVQLILSAPTVDVNMADKNGCTLGTAGAATACVWSVRSRLQKVWGPRGRWSLSALKWALWIAIVI